jgi:hypothetical protein
MVYLKKLSFLLLCTSILLACGGKSGSQSATQTDTPQVSVGPNLADSTPLESAANLNAKTLTVKARFVEFSLGDAEHYVFEDQTGKTLEFAGSECEKFNFTRELPANESDETNQGWGSNKELQGKWFTLTYLKREQPEYTDGPVALVDIITDAVLVEK